MEISYIPANADEEQKQFAEAIALSKLSFEYENSDEFATVIAGINEADEAESAIFEHAAMVAALEESREWALVNGIPVDDALCNSEVVAEEELYRLVGEIAALSVTHSQDVVTNMRNMLAEGQTSAEIIRVLDLRGLVRFLRSRKPE